MHVITGKVHRALQQPQGIWDLMRFERERVQA
jgi:hypothetical protein